jgi:hypothetical protein
MTDMATFELDDDDMPEPGETVEVDLGGGLVALLENTNEPAQEEGSSPLPLTQQSRRSEQPR